MNERDDAVWRPIPGYEARYWVSSHGRVMSSRNPSKPGRLMKMLFEDGTFSFYLSFDGKKQSVFLRDLVLETFVGPRPNGFEVRHLDGTRENCCLDNLF
jgi:NUMOD4 motif/HNH endonuclease